jgi:hypothetical protein
MEFPIEIQMLINDYLRPITRPDWRKGSYMKRYYKSWWGQSGRLLFHEFKSYINRCSNIEQDEGEETYKSWADYFEFRHIKDDIDILYMREDDYKREKGYESEEEIDNEFY